MIPQRFLLAIVLVEVKKELVMDFVISTMVVMRQSLERMDLMLQVEALVRVLKQDFLKQENIEFV